MMMNQEANGQDGDEKPIKRYEDIVRDIKMELTRGKVERKHQNDPEFYDERELDSQRSLSDEED